MKKDQNSITIRFENNKIKEKLFNYLRLSHASDNTQLIHLLNIAIDTESGDFKDKKIMELIQTIKLQTQAINLQTETIKSLNRGMADLQDAITGQSPDLSYLLKKQTNKED